MTIRNIKKPNAIGFIFIIFIIFILFAGVTVAIDKVLLSSKNVNPPINNNSLLSKKQEITNIPLDEKGNVYFEENEMFKKYTLLLPKDSSVEHSGDNNNSLCLKLGEDVKITLNGKGKRQEDFSGLYLDKAKGKNVLEIAEKFNKNNFAYINDVKDTKKVVVLISKVEQPFKHKVVLDAGHGGEDAGTNIGTLLEKNLTLKIVKYMESDLVYSGVEAVLTRNKDELLALSEIADIANKNNPDAFMSVHINSSNYTKQTPGVQAYYYYESGAPENERINLADTVMKHMVKSDGWQNKGILKNNYKILRLCKYPSTLVECGYINNAEDRARMEDDEILERLAKNLSEGIEEYVKANVTK